MTTCPKDGQPMEEDLTFRATLASYGVPRTRLVCLAGHSVYHDYAAQEREKPGRRCGRCGEPITRDRANLCDDCASPQTLAKRLAGRGA